MKFYCEEKTHTLFNKEYTNEELYDIATGNDEWDNITEEIDSGSDMSKGSAVYYYESVNKENPKLYVLIVVEQGILDNNNDHVYDIWVEDWTDEYDPDADLKETVSENLHLLSQKELAHDHNLADMDKVWDWIKQHATLEDSMWTTKKSFKEAMEDW